MSVRQRPDLLLSRRLRLLSARLPAAVALEPAAVHRARVASRRVRELLPALVDVLPDDRVHRARRRVRWFARTLGPVRDLDVSLRMLERLADAAWAGTVPDALEDLRRHLLSEREGAAAWTRHRLARFDPARFERRLVELAVRAGASIEHGDERWRSGLERRIGKRARGLRIAVDEAGALYLPGRLHAVRIAAKKLRYTLEVAEATRVAAVRAPIRALQAAQRTLGRLHDLEFVLERVRSLEAAGPLRADQPRDAAPRSALESLVGDIEVRCRNLHAAYLAGRKRLGQAAAAAGEIAPRASGVHRICPTRPSCT